MTVSWRRSSARPPAWSSARNGVPHVAQKFASGGAAVPHAPHATVDIGFRPPRSCKTVLGPRPHPRRAGGEEAPERARAPLVQSPQREVQPLRAQSARARFARLVEASVPGTVIVGTQWGDEGKGRFTDYLSKSSHLVVRYQGGHNAGHTIVVDGTRFALQLVPSG